MIKNQSIYKGLECYCDEFERIPIDRRDLGIAGNVATYVVAITGGFAIYGAEKYSNNMNINSITTEVTKLKIKMNFGILSFLQAKIEGKSNERALIETGIAIGIGSAMETKVAQVAIKTGVSLLTRIATGAATGAAVGSAFPIIGTIIGAVAGTLIAGVINDEIFENEDKALESAKAENEKIAKLEKSYLLKINAINDYLIKNNYKELRILNENEAENLCREASNLQSDYFKTIELMLSYKDYLSTDSTESTAQASHTSSLDSSSSNLESSPIASKSSYTNPHPNNNKTINFQLIIKDYNTFELLSNKQIRIANIDSKQILSKTTNSQGEVVFSIKESERGDFFNIELINDNDYEQNPYYLAKQTLTNPQGQQTAQQTIQKILTPNNYQNHPAVLYFNKKQNGNIIIGVLKAYKINNTKRENKSKTINDLDSTGLSNSHNEIYTIDIEQTIQLRAFVYEEQRTYVKEVEDEKTQIKYEDTLQQGNITKNIKELSLEESSQIQWAFKIVNGTYLAEESKENHQNTKKEANKGNTRKEPFPLLSDKQTFSIAKGNKLDSIPQGYVELENKTGDYINLSLKDLFTDKVLESLVGKNIIFFAYVNQPAYCIYQDNGRSGSKKQVLKDRVTSIELKILQTRFSLEFDGETLMLLENQRILKEWNVSSEKAIENLQENDTQGNHTITTTYNPHLLDLKGINLDLLGEQKEKLKEDICKTLQDYNIKENLLIPLKVKYQKRILIVIERFKETSEATKARMNIYIDRKRVDRNGNIIGEKIKQYEYYNPYFLPKENPYAYILERPSPDSIGGELKLRIPSGKYNALWNKEKDVSELKEGEKIPWNANTLNLYNDFVAQGRAILIHNGNSPKNSDGCLLINQNQIFKDKEQTIEVDNILQAGKKNILAEHIKDKFTKAILGKMTQNLREFVREQIEIQIINHFTKE